MAIGLSRRRFASLGAGLLLPDLMAVGGFGNSAWAGRLPDVGQNLAETLPQPVPPFHFMDAAGRRLTLTHYAGAGLVVNFWATWCGPCRRELPSLVAFDREVRPLGIRVLPIAIDSDGIQAVAPYYERHGIKGVPMLFDPHSNGLRAFGESGIPFSVIIDRRGELVASLEGAGNWDGADTVAQVRRLVGPRAGVVATPGGVTPA